MHTASNPLVDMYQTQLEASRRLADVMLSGTERIDHVLIEAAHRAITDQLNLAQAVVSARDSNGVAKLQATYLSRRPDNAVNYQREMAQIFADIQNEIGKSMQYYMEQVGSTISSNAASTTRARPQAQPNGNTFDPVTGIFSAWETAFREVASMANRNLAVARSSLEKMASATVEAAQRGNGAAVDDATFAADATGARAKGGDAHGERKAHSTGKRAGR